MRRVSVLAIAAAVALLSPGSPGLAGAPRSHAFVGKSCTETWVLYFLDEPTLRRHVPARFAIEFVAADRGELLISVTRCEKSTLNGTSIGPTLLSEVGIYIAEPKERKNAVRHQVHWDYYQLWHLTNVPALRTAFSALGVDGGTISKATWTATSAASTDADVPWDRVPYSFRAGVPVPSSAFGARPSAFWHQGRKGLVVTSYEAVETSLVSGGGQLRTSATGPIAKMVGAETSVVHNATQAHYSTLKATFTLLGK
ncbi:MAG TPA: hypothetical protein VNA30_05755 [Mycobacteriales bacterium]|nr:hypothetical protein [Mycobacteriales bacterium]